MLYRIEEVCARVQTHRGEQVLSQITLVLNKLTDYETEQVRLAITTLIQQLKDHQFP